MNAQIIHFLQAARFQVVKFLNNSGPYDHLTLKAVKRTCELTKKGFVIRVIGQIQKVEPRIETWLLTRPWPAFRPKGNGVYGRQLGEHIRVVFYNHEAGMTQRWYIGYEITCPYKPQLIDPDADTEKIEEWLLRVIWRRVMAESRTRVWHRRQL